MDLADILGAKLLFFTLLKQLCGKDRVIVNEKQIVLVKKKVIVHFNIFIIE